MNIANISSKSYSILFLFTVLIIFVPAFFVGIQLEPLYGDLTRIGNYSEKEFGWNEPSFKLEDGTFKKGSLRKKYDIIILGDSFTTAKSSYARIFIKKTGLNIGTFFTRDYRIEDFIEALKSNNNNLPKLFIYETVERNLKKRLHKFTNCPSSLLPPPKTEALKYNNYKLRTQIYTRNVEYSGFPDLGYTWRYMYNSFFSTDTKSKKLTLKNKKLFSNKKSNEILVYQNDFEKLNWTSDDWNIIKCNAMHIQNTMHELNVNFILLVAPDKTTVYKNYIADENISGSKLSLLEDKELNFLRVDNLLQKKVENGEMDVYWPNNTHWSFKGHLAVSEKLIKYLEDKKLIFNSTIDN